jgi:hypothetical protein
MNLLKTRVFSRLLFIFFASAALGAGESRDLRLADYYYDRDEYSRAYELYQQSVLRQERGGLSGDTLYRYAYSYEQTRGLDDTALKIYALSWYYNKKEGRPGAKYALYAGAKLKDNSVREPDDGAAVSILEELRASIGRERKTYFYGWVDRIYPLISRFSVFQWKIIASLAMLIPFLGGTLILWFRRRKNLL